MLVIIWFHLLSWNYFSDIVPTHEIELVYVEAILICHEYEQRNACENFHCDAVPAPHINLRVVFEIDAYHLAKLIEPAAHLRVQDVFA